MKNRLLWFSPIMILASCLTTLSADDQQYKIYLSKNYEQSYIEYKKLLQDDYSNPIHNFFFGKSAIALGKFNEAMSAFERILLIDPTHIGAKFELINIYILQNNFELAKVELDSINKDNLSKDQQEMIISLEKLLKPDNQKMNINVIAGVGFGYNSNVTNGNDITTILNNLSVSNEKKSDHYTFETFAINMKLPNNHFNYNSDWLFSFGAYNENYSTLEDFDIQVYNGQAGINFKYNDIDIRYLYGLTNYDILNKSWLNQYTHEARLSYSATKNIFTSGTVSYYKKINLLEENEDKDAIGRLVGLKIYYIEPNQMFSGSFISKNESRVRGERSDIENDSQTIQLQYAKQLSNNLSISTEINKENIEYPYLYVDPINIKRKDKILTLGTSLAYSFRKDLKLNMNIYKKRSDSTIFLYEYDQIIDKISLEYNF